MEIRQLEKSKKLGFLFFITYNGKEFATFDEMRDKNNINKKSVKGTFSGIMNDIGFFWANGLQQGARTDSNVSAIENILYASSNFTLDINELMSKFNNISGKNLQIKKIYKTFPNLVIPSLITAREYIYRPRLKYIIDPIDVIVKRCSELSGIYDVSDFTDNKGKLLKEHVRSVEISFKNNSLIFKGNSFMPHQVRIMSSYILSGNKNPYPAKYLTLNKLYLDENLKNMILKSIDMDNLDFDDMHYNKNIEKIEKTTDGSLYIFYVKRENKGAVIGKNGKNINVLKKKFGNIVIKEI
ncbi:MAG: KH domain-containing protein [Fusobacteriaceae bacterium]|jgi:tRNA pseudouridine(38-40) synthase|nr:KH domain-containing protein [Fusobacteriaceae bacterium]